MAAHQGFDDLQPQAPALTALAAAFVQLVEPLEQQRQLLRRNGGTLICHRNEYLLGIRQEPDSAGYKSIIIEPLEVSQFNFMRGSIKAPMGDIAVSYKKENSIISFEITIPKGCEASFKYSEGVYPLSVGMNKLDFQI